MKTVSRAVPAAPPAPAPALPPTAAGAVAPAREASEPATPEPVPAAPRPLGAVPLDPALATAAGCDPVPAAPLPIPAGGVCELSGDCPATPPAPDIERGSPLAPSAETSWSEAQPSPASTNPSMRQGGMSARRPRSGRRAASTRADMFRSPGRRSMGSWRHRLDRHSKHNPRMRRQPREADRSSGTPGAQDAARAPRPSAYSDMRAKNPAAGSSSATERPVSDSCSA